MTAKAGYLEHIYDLARKLATKAGENWEQLTAFEQNDYIAKASRLPEVRLQ